MNSYILTILALLQFIAPALLAQTTRQKIKGGLKNDIVYYIMVDRFYDGDESNNIPEAAYPLNANLSKKELKYNQLNRQMLKEIYDPSRRFAGMYWGGDLRGVIKKLPYLKELGVTQILLTPIMQNVKGWVNNTINFSPTFVGMLVDGGKTGSYYIHQEALDQSTHPFATRMTAYHGYWTKDWFRVEEHFGSSDFEKGLEIFRELLIKANDLKMGVILDITLNHTSPILGHDIKNKRFYYDGKSNLFPDHGSFYRDGTLVGVAAKITGPGEKSPYPNLATEYNPDGLFNSFDIPDLNYDNGTPSKWQEERARIAGGIPDLNQDNPIVNDYLLDATEFWLNFNKDNPNPKKRVTISGFRLDAIKHVPTDFWERFEDKVFSIKPDAIVFGEYFDGGWSNEKSLEYLNRMDNSSMFNFHLSFAFRNFFGGERNWFGRVSVMDGHMNMTSSESWLTYSPIRGVWNQDQFPNIDSDDSKGWVNFIENHDIPRLKNTFPSMSDTAYMSAIGMLLMAEGVPLLMYGTETALSSPNHIEHTGLFGKGGDPFNRPMMVFEDHPGFKKEMFEYTRKVINLRKKYPLLRFGESLFLEKKSDSFVMLRFDNHSPEKILYAYSDKTKTYSIKLKEIKKNASRIRNFITQGKNKPFINSKTKTLDFKLDPFESMIVVVD